jgi:hypothetical protein
MQPAQDQAGPFRQDRFPHMLLPNIGAENPDISSKQPGSGGLQFSGRIPPVDASQYVTRLEIVK